MTQTARPQTPWLVPVGKSSDMEHETFTRICRGHVPLGKVLGYFVYEASWQAKNEGMDITHIESIPLKREQKKILAQVKISQNSLTTYIKQLVEWGYIQADTHRHTYAVCFQTINTAIADPPALFPKKPRGKHAPPKVISPESQAKTDQEKIAKLRNKLTTLGKRFSNLGIQITTLRNELSNLGITEFAESASEQGFEGNSEAPRIYRITKDIIEDSLVASANAESDAGASFLSSLSQFEETLREVQNGQAPLQASVAHRREEEPVKEADTSKTPAVTSAVNDTTNVSLQEIPTEPLFPTAQSLPSNKTNEKGNSKLSGKKDTRSPIDRTRCQKWQVFFNARRGGEPLALKGPRINESECIISLVQKFTDEQITAIDTFVLAEIFPHKLPANKHKVGARIVLDESQNAREVLKDRFKWPGQVIVPVEEPKIVGWTPVRQIYPPKGVTVTYG
jgi:hypothetical protein